MLMGKVFYSPTMKSTLVKRGLRNGVLETVGPGALRVGCGDAGTLAGRAGMVSRASVSEARDEGGREVGPDVPPGHLSPSPRAAPPDEGMARARTSEPYGGDRKSTRLNSSHSS